jgi:hypothetical protein
MREEQVTPALARDPGPCRNRPRTMLDASKRGMGRHQRLPHNESRISGEPLLRSFGEGTQSAAKPHEPPASKAQRPKA